MLDYACLNFLPSEIAASAVVLALHTVRRPYWVRHPAPGAASRARGSTHRAMARTAMVGVVPLAAAWYVASFWSQHESTGGGVHPAALHGTATVPAVYIEFIAVADGARSMIAIVARLGVASSSARRPRSPSWPCTTTTAVLLVRRLASFGRLGRTRTRWRDLVRFIGQPPQFSSGM